MDMWWPYDHPSPLLAVRRRPGMYFGGTDIEAMHNLAYCVIIESLEEAIAGRVNRIDIILRNGCEILIKDNSFGFSTDYSDMYFTSNLEAHLTQLYASKERLGLRLHGPWLALNTYGGSLAAVNALSETMRIETSHEGFLWNQEYKLGIPQAPVERVRPLGPGESTGFSTCFKPDFTIMDRNSFEFDRLADHCRRMAYLIENLTICLRDERTTPVREAVFFASDGVKNLLEDISQAAMTLHEPIWHRSRFTVPQRPHKDQRQYEIQLQFAFVFTGDRKSSEISFANTTASLMGGGHVRAFHQGLLRTLNRYRNGNPDRPFRWKDVAPSLIAAISVYHPDAGFTSSRETFLINTDLITPMAKRVADTFALFAETNHDKVQKILEVCRVNAISE